MTESVKELLKDLDEFVDGLIRKLTFDITSILGGPAINGGTPIDTGWARSNWIPSVGQPVKDPAGSKLAVTRAPQTAGMQELLAYTREKGKVFISNNVPYIGRLNDGSSDQAPAGFVQRAIVKAITDLSR